MNTIFQENGKRLNPTRKKRSTGSGWTAEAIDALRDQCRRWRIAAGHTQRDMAKRLGWHHNTITNFEGGNHTPSARSLDRIKAIIAIYRQEAERIDEASNLHFVQASRAADEYPVSGSEASHRSTASASAPQQPPGPDWRWVEAAYQAGRKDLVDALREEIDRREELLGGVSESDVKIEKLMTALKGIYHGQQRKRGTKP